MVPQAAAPVWNSAALPGLGQAAAVAQFGGAVVHKTKTKNLATGHWWQRALLHLLPPPLRPHEHAHPHVACSIFGLLELGAAPAHAHPQATAAAGGRSNGALGGAPTTGWSQAVHPVGTLWGRLPLVSQEWPGSAPSP